MANPGRRQAKFADVGAFVGGSYGADLQLLSDNGIAVWDSFARWAPHQVGGRRDILVAMDWTDFDRDDQAMLALNLVSGHGRAAPLPWLSVWKDGLTKQRNDCKDACLRRLAELAPCGCRVTFLADPGFGYVAHFRGNIHVTDADATTKPAAEWVGKGVPACCWTRA